MLDKMKVVGYTRFSSDNQREESITAQKRFINMYADNNQLEIIDWYTDEAKSGKTMDRPDFQRLLNDAQNHPEFKAIVVHKFDRFSRNTEDTLHYIKRFKDFGIEVISVSEPIEDTPAGRMMLTLMSSVNEYYIANLSREVMKGMTENALQGLWTGGPAPLGYNLKDKHLVINEEEAKAVRLIFEMAANGYGYGQIVDKLNVLGYKTKKGRSFGKNSIFDLISNERYKGTYVFNRRSAANSLNKRNNHKFKDESEIIRIEGGNPAIVSPELWHRANAVRKATKYNRENTNNPYLLSGLIHCSCGGKFHGEVERHLQKGTERRTYRCNSRINKRSCHTKEINCDMLDSWVIDQFLKFFFADENIPIIVRGLNEQLQKNALGGKQYEEAKENLKVLEKSRDNLIEAIIQTGTNESISARIRDYEQQISNTKQFIESIEQRVQTAVITVEDVKSKINELRAYMLKPENMTRTKYFLSQYIERVEISNETVKANFKVAFTIHGENTVYSTFTHDEDITRRALQKDYSEEESNRIIEKLSLFAS